jgi:serine/threonine protein kinase
MPVEARITSFQFDARLRASQYTLRRDRSPYPLSLPRITLQTKQSMNQYTEIKELGRGTYGVVTLAKVKESNTRVLEKLRTIAASSLTTATTTTTTDDQSLWVAIKRIKGQPLNGGTDSSSKSGVNISALREIKVLREFSNDAPPNILLLLDAFTPPDKSGDISAVYEYCPQDLANIINPQINLLAITKGDVKSFMISMLTGVAYIHVKGCLHRDLKPDNLLFNPRGIMKIGDFGLSRLIPSPGQPMSSEPITQWYKPPELLLSEIYYGSAVDIWSCGCIFAELMLRRPFLAGEEGDFKQLEKIFNVYGLPDEDVWRGAELLPSVIRGLKWESMSSGNGGTGGVKLEDIFPSQSNDAVDCLRCMMYLDPNKRWSAKRLLEEHDYFKLEPPPSRVEDLPLGM